MRKALLVMAGGLLASGSLAVADPLVFGDIDCPLDLEIVVTGDQIDAVNGVTGVELDGVAVYGATPNVYMFDSFSGSDQILAYNGSAVSVFATEAQIGNGSASAGDMDAAADGTLYLSTFIGSNNQSIWSIPAAGFGSATLMIDTAGTIDAQLSQVELDTANSRLLLSYNDAFSTAAEDIITVPLNASSVTSVTTIITEADIETILAGMTGYVDDGADDLNIYDMTVQSDGDIIVSHGFSSNRQINGSLLRISSDGTTTREVFMSADDLITAAGGNPATVDIGSVAVEALSGDEILVHVNFTSLSIEDDPVNGFDPFIGVVSADGTSLIKLATLTQLSADADVTTALVPTGESLFRVDGKNGDVAANDDYYFYRQGLGSGAASENAVLALTGVRAYIDGPASVKNWTMY